LRLYCGITDIYIQDTISSFSEGHFWELDFGAESSSSFGVPNCGDAVYDCTIDTTLSGYVHFDNGNNEEDDDDDDNPSATVLRVLIFPTRNTMIAILVGCVHASMRISSVIVMGVVNDHRGSKIFDRTIIYSGAVRAASLSPFIHSPMLARYTCPRVAHPSRSHESLCVCMMCVVVVVVVLKEKEIVNKVRIKEQYQDTTLQSRSRSRSREGGIATLAQQPQPQPQQQPQPQPQQSHPPQQEPQ